MNNDWKIFAVFVGGFTITMVALAISKPTNSSIENEKLRVACVEKVKDRPIDEIIKVCGRP